MPLLCIGGVCIPWTVLFPVVCYALRPLYNVLPKPLQEWCDVLHAKIMAFIEWCTPAWMKPKGKKAEKKAKGDAAAASALTDEERAAVLDRYRSEGTAVELEDYEHLEVLMSHHDGPVLAYYTAAWCKPCQKIKPLVHDTADKHRHVKVVSIDIDEHTEAADEHGIFKVPTLIVFKDGAEAHRGNNEDVLAHASLGK